MKTALILGVSGQDGAYLSRLLLQKGYAVHGTSRDQAQNFSRLRALALRDSVTVHSLPTTDRESLRGILRSVRPDEIYNLSGLSSVALSFQQPAIAWASIAEAQQILLDSVASILPSARVYCAASSECFGDVPVGSAAGEATPFAPCSPYAEAKVAAHTATVAARDALGLFACSGFMFNHESPMRPTTFVTRKIISAAAAAAKDRAGDKLYLGDVSAARDWGYAAEYVEAMWLMLQQREPQDFVIATGESHTVAEFAAAAFSEFGLDARDHVVVDDSLFRRAEIRYSRGDATRAREMLGWTARTKFKDLIRLLAEAERHADAGPMQVRV